MHWHHRFVHKNCTSIQQLFRIEPFNSHKFQSTGRCELPKYEICQYAKAHRKPNRGKISTVDSIADGYLKAEHLRHGSGKDHFESRLKGRPYSSYSKITSDQYIGG